MSPPLHTSVRKGLPAGQPSTALDVGKFIEGGSDAPESGLAHPPEIRLRRPGRAPLDEAADARLPGPIRRASGHERSPSSAGLSETLALLLAYDGAAFRGWQKQPGMQTVQGTLEDALRLLLGKRPIVHGASRTDAGVHASGQVASFRSGRAPDLDRLPAAARSASATGTTCADSSPAPRTGGERVRRWKACAACRICRGSALRPRNTGQRRRSRPGPSGTTAFSRSRALRSASTRCATWPVILVRSRLATPHPRRCASWRRAPGPGWAREPRRTGSRWSRCCTRPS